ncbi:hypothetical protein [Vibrio phage vB_VpM-pA2SJ1]|uniref:Uncharacterized protein n=1 Tax=Vibrio phage vB_VpM-pA2SJ1 TaxID=3095964 RepID=A0AAX4J5P5_9CAUD
MNNLMYRHKLTGDDVMKYNKHRVKRNLLTPGDIMLMTVGIIILLGMSAGLLLDLNLNNIMLLLS